MANDTRPLFCFYDDSDYVIAHDAGDASEVWAVTVGESHDDTDCPWGDALAADRALSVDLDDGRGPRRQTVSEWIAEVGRGFFCSENV